MPNATMPNEMFYTTLLHQHFHKDFSNKILRHFTDIRSGQVRSGQVSSGQFRSGQFRSVQVSSGQVRSGQVVITKPVQPLMPPLTPFIDFSLLLFPGVMHGHRLFTTTFQDMKHTHILFCYFPPELASCPFDGPYRLLAACRIFNIKMYCDADYWANKMLACYVQ